MRTTVTLDDDVVAAVQVVMRERGISFKEALNELVRAGLGAAQAPSRPYLLKTRRLDVRPGVDLDKANRLAAQLEDEEIVRKYELGR